MSDMVERVAKAMRENLGVDWPYAGHEYLLDAARAAIEAMREPSEAMVQATERGLFEHMPEARDWTLTIAKSAFRAAIDEALK